MKAILVNGWGIEAEAAYEAICGESASIELSVVQPVPNWENRLAQESSGCDTLIGYSLGAFLLMLRPELAMGFSRRILLAPFFDFKREAGLGGKVKKAQLYALKRWLQREPLEAIDDFYGKAGLSFATPSKLPCSIDDLLWGLDRLAEDSAQPSSLRGFEAYIGEDDALLDAKRIHALSLGISRIAGIGHDLPQLWQRALASESKEA